ncbi:hypothetical protein HYH02_015539 [Chlamydomonas schloesseri]|uniref:Uncharacterized protein n=1 Tax=Chlamydomonas schloesseri TaxID=2026947 RepID=A0A835S808_9CHLO|nr:hypothetical protein HYH02_015539 [Chlamydomonas schloesseri]|eukprot:KAG2422019.1 hypothetical protein HYH02_015539 [Chlamydomonas schloesseri]
MHPSQSQLYRGSFRGAAMADRKHGRPNSRSSKVGGAPSSTTTQEGSLGGVSFRNNVLRLCYEAAICGLMAAAVGLFFTYAIHLSSKDSFTPQAPGEAGRWRLPADTAPWEALGAEFGRVYNMHQAVVLYSFLQPRLAVISRTLSCALPDLVHLFAVATALLSSASILPSCDRVVTGMANVLSCLVFTTIIGRFVLALILGPFQAGGHRLWCWRGGGARSAAKATSPPGAMAAAAAAVKLRSRTCGTLNMMGVKGGGDGAAIDVNDVLGEAVSAPGQLASAGGMRRPASAGANTARRPLSPQPAMLSGARLRAAPEAQEATPATAIPASALTPAVRRPVRVTSRHQWPE